MTLNELNEIKEILSLTQTYLLASETSDYKRITKSIWIIQREIELKTKCTETKYSHREK